MNVLKINVGRGLDVETIDVFFVNMEDFWREAFATIVANPVLDGLSIEQQHDLVEKTKDMCIRYLSFADCFDDITVVRYFNFGSLCINVEIWKET